MTVPDPSPSIAPPSRIQSALAKGSPGCAGEPLADVLVAVEIIFAAPAVEAEALRAGARAAAQHDRPGIAQPDIAERLDDDFGERGERSRAFGGAVMGCDQPDLLALAAGVDRLGESRDFALGRLEIAEPQLRVARKADPHRLVRRPFGRGGGEWQS